MSIAGLRMSPEHLLSLYDLDKLKQECKPLIDSMNEDMESFREQHKNFWVNSEGVAEGVILTATTGVYLVLCTDGEIRGVSQAQRESGRT